MVFDPLAAVAALSIMATVMVALFAFYGNAVPSSNVRGRLEGLMSGTAVMEAGNSAALRTSRTDTGVLAKVTSQNISERLTQELERADMTLSPGEYIVIRLALAAVGFIAPFFFIQGVLGFALMAVAALVGYNAPKMYMNKRRKSRVQKLNAQLPEALTMISNSLKAGFGLLQALSVASEQLSHPISTEFGRTIHEMNIGSGAEESLIALGERSSSYDLDIVITSLSASGPVILKKDLEMLMPKRQNKSLFMIDIGVPRPSAQGHAMRSTATALTMPCASRGCGPNTSQPTSVSTADSRIAGTK